jgi:hypothetical protein
VRKNQRLDHRRHLEYVLDHEIFHCLDALYNRPIPMSRDKRTTEYFHFLNENGADAFALAMQIKRCGRGSKYPERLAHIRGLSLFWGDPGHFTFDAARQILEREKNEFEQMSVRDVLALAASIRDRVAPTFRDFLEYESAAMEASRLLEDGFEPGCRNMLEQQRDRVLSIRDRLLLTSCTCYATVFGPSLRVPQD